MNELERAKNYFQKDGVNYYPFLLDMENDTKLKENNIDLNLFIDCVENFVKGANPNPKDGKGITSAQLRNVYSKAQSAKSVNALTLMRPKIAYTIARQKNNDAKITLYLLDDLIKQVKTDEQLKGFKTFFEAIVAFHRQVEAEKEKNTSNS